MCTQILEVVDRRWCDCYTCLQNGLLAVVEVPRSEDRTVVAAVVVRVIGYRANVDQGILVGRHIGFGFTADELSQV